MELHVPPQVTSGCIFIRAADDAVSTSYAEAVDRRLPMDDVVVHDLTIPLSTVTLHQVDPAKIPLLVVSCKL